MTDAYRADRTLSAEADQSAVSISAVLAGGISAAALTLVLLAFGSAMGFSAVSPWADSGISAGTFKLATGIFLVVCAMLSSTVGGYIAGRLRTKWTGLQSDEVLFRDTAHGFLAWAVATVFGAALLGAAATYVLGGAATGAAQGAAQKAADPNDYFVQMLFRPGPGGQASAPGAQTPGAPGGPIAGSPGVSPAGTSSMQSSDPTRDAGLIFTRSLTARGDLPAADRTYLAQMVAARTGMSQPEAEKRVADVYTQAKAAADQARKDAAKLSIWLAIAMLVGAFSASLAAIEGGQLRDGRWKGVIGGKNYRTTTQVN
jgi:hypothetical protein